MNLVENVLYIRSKQEINKHEVNQQTYVMSYAMLVLHGNHGIHPPILTFHLLLFPLSGKHIQSNLY